MYYVSIVLKYDVFSGYLRWGKKTTNLSTTQGYASGWIKMTTEHVKSKSISSFIFLQKARKLFYYYAGCIKTAAKFFDNVVFDVSRAGYSKFWFFRNFQLVYKFGKRAVIKSPVTTTQHVCFFPRYSNKNENDDDAM